MNRLHLGEIHDANIGDEARELSEGFKEGAAPVGLRICELKKSRIRLRASGRTVKMEGREAAARVGER